MKFFEWTTLIFGILCALAADSSIVWSLTCGVLCVVSLLFRKIAEELEADYRKYKKCTGQSASQSDATKSTSINGDSSKFLPSDYTRVWEDIQHGNI